MRRDSHAKSNGGALVIDLPIETQTSQVSSPARAARSSRKQRIRDRREQRGEAVSGVFVARLVGADAAGSAVVEWSDGGEGRIAVARSLASLGPADIGADVALMFEGGDVARPLVVGPIGGTRGNDVRAAGPDTARSRPAITFDGKQLMVTAEESIVLRCGESSITLTRDGRVFIRGVYLVSRAATLNRIKGGSVQIN